KSKAGKRYGFVRFIRVYDVDRLVSNLCTLWMGSNHLHANVTRFMRPPTVKSGGYTHQNDIEGIPLKLWSESTFNRIAAKWGKMLYLEKLDEGCLYSKSEGKETTGWIPNFDEQEEDNSESEDEQSIEVECDKKSMGNNEGSGFGNEKGESVSIRSRKSNKIDIQRTGGSLLTVMEELIKLQDKNKDLENVVCKMGKSTKTLRLLTNEQKAFRDNLRKSGLGYNGPYVLSQAYAKMYRAYELYDQNEQLHVFDYEDTLENVEQSRLKMNEFQKDEKVQALKIKPIDY
nr:ChaC-like family protein [Tanacetum cinerariifolium]